MAEPCERWLPSRGTAAMGTVAAAASVAGLDVLGRAPPLHVGLLAVLALLAGAPHPVMRRLRPLLLMVVAGVATQALPHVPGALLVTTALIAVVRTRDDRDVGGRPPRGVHPRAAVTEDRRP